ncbi:MAG: hypothetical protein FJ399_07635 [Verrucomicrobia bacterium]|nr:hypothetical protein [Verrucomicrobiota bacterium]
MRLNPVRADSRLESRRRHLVEGPDRHEHALGCHGVQPRRTKNRESQPLAAPREVFRTAMRQAASAIVCVHNHPAGVLLNGF